MDGLFFHLWVVPDWGLLIIALAALALLGWWGDKFDRYRFGETFGFDPKSDADNDRAGNNIVRQVLQEKQREIAASRTKREEIECQVLRSSQINEAQDIYFNLEEHDRQHALLEKKLERAVELAVRLRYKGGVKDAGFGEYIAEEIPA